TAGMRGVIFTSARHSPVVNQTEPLSWPFRWLAYPCAEVENGMKICVTGSSGLIGRCLTLRLRLMGMEVLPVDRSDNPAIDILDRKALDDALARCDGVVHLAAVSRVKWAEAHPRRC